MAKSEVLLFADLLSQISSNEPGCYRLCTMPPVTLDEGASWQTTADATALFLAALATITTQLSEPDPADTAAASKSARGLHAHWDFDYYRWDLWLAERSGGHALVFLERN